MEKKKLRQSGQSAKSISPYIKPEPTSRTPSPVEALPRPQKRPRQMVPQAGGLDYDEPTGSAQQGRPRAQNQRAHTLYDHEQRRHDQEYDSHGPSPVSYQRPILRDDADYRRVATDHYSRRPQSPVTQALPYSPTEPRLRAITHSNIERQFQEPHGYYKNPPPQRIPIRVDSDRERSRSPVPVAWERPAASRMAPPRPAAARIMVDEAGREFYEIERLPPVRQSVAAPIRYGEPIYTPDRAPMRMVPSRAVDDSYGEMPLNYRREEPLTAIPRRILPQVENDPVDYRAYRQREYSVRPVAMAPPLEDYTPVRAPTELRQRDYSVRPSASAPQLNEYMANRDHIEQRPREYSVRPVATLPPYDEFVTPSAPQYRPMTQYEEPVRGYVSRVASVRPEGRPEPIRYEVPREYISRVGSVRPEAINREMAGSVRPELRREMLPPGMRAVSVRPVGDGYIRREGIPLAPEDGYELSRPVRRYAEDVEYIERPRERQQVIYGNEHRPDIYR